MSSQQVFEARTQVYLKALALATIASISIDDWEMQISANLAQANRELQEALNMYERTRGYAAR